MTTQDGATMPRRIQRQRKKGWRKPDNAVIVDRTTRWGNPFVVGKHGNAEECVEKFRTQLIARVKQVPYLLEPLRGKDLACFCPLDQVCHAEILLELANK